MGKRAKVYVGTSGWHYKHWRGTFYPEEVKPPEYLSYFLKYLDTVEVNNSFYRLPALETMQAWREKVPKRFLFAVKANRYITHMKKLNDTEQQLRDLYDRVDALGEKAGPILFQLPPGWSFNPERLQSFLNTLSTSYRHVFEFRNHTWYDERAYEMLEKHKAAFCIYELAGHISPRVITSNFVYIRLHGPGGKYQGLYSEEVLQGWADRMKGWQKDGLDVYCYFDNDQEGYAVKNAIQLKEMMQA